jgi:signal peptidase I
LNETPVELWPAPQPSHRWHWLRDLAQTVLLPVFIAILVNLFLAQSYIVYGQSMQANLQPNQRVIVEKVSYHFHGPQRGDIVVLKRPGWEEEPWWKRLTSLVGGYVRVQDEDVPLIKRVIALPGEKVEIRDGIVLVDGQPLSEPYLNQRTPGLMAPLVVPPLHVFVMGDNRAASNDSRYFGPVAIEDILGKAWVSYWPIEDMRVLD